MKPHKPSGKKTKPESDNMVYNPKHTSKIGKDAIDPPFQTDPKRVIDPRQSQAFIDKTRELVCDESGAKFEERK